MPAFLSSPMAGRRRFVVIAFVIVVVVLYTARQSAVSSWDVGLLNPDLDAAAGSRPGAGGGSSSGSDSSASHASPAEKGGGGTASGNSDSYRKHEYNPLHPTKDAAIPPQETPAPNRWVDKPLQNTNGGSVSEDGTLDPCKDFMAYMRLRPGPASGGKRQFPLMRPPSHCRTFNLPDMEDLITSMRSRIRDPDLYRLFENAYPNTLDTMIKWRGYAEEPKDMELTYVITGDIDAMWLRDSASQIYSYLPLLKASSDQDSLASLWRGVINSHSRYIIISPYCHSFQPPPESGIKPTANGANHVNHPIPGFDANKVFDCKWELDSLGSFLQISAAYYDRTGDVDFFKKFVWVDAVEAAVNAAGAMRLGTYAPDGKVEDSAYKFTGQTTRGSETLTNDGLGNPVRENGMVRSSFRPSDDACIFQHLTPSNMLWGKYLEEASHIMEKIDTPKAQNLTKYMRSQALGIRAGIAMDAVVEHKKYGKVFAYEVDGYGSANMMDDSNIPSLLAMPLFNFTKTTIPEHESLVGGRSSSKLSETTISDDSQSVASSAPASSATPSEMAISNAGRISNIFGQNEKDLENKPDGRAGLDKEETEVLPQLEKETEEGREKAVVEEMEKRATAALQARSSVDDADTIPEHDYAAVYQASRKFILSSDNPYYMWGPVMSAVGGPHLGPGKAWPMAAIVAAMTAYDPISGIEKPEELVGEQLGMILDSTNGAGLIHESVSSHRETDWSRPWFGWANGLFGELILRVAENEKEGEGLLARSWQS